MAAIQNQKSALLEQHKKAQEDRERQMQDRRSLNISTSFMPSLVSQSSLPSKSNLFPSFPTISPQENAGGESAVESGNRQEDSEYEDTEEGECDSEEEDEQFEDAISDLSASVRASSTNGTDEEKKTSDYFSQLVSRYKRLQQNKIKAVRAVADDTLESIEESRRLKEEIDELRREIEMYLEIFRRGSERSEEKRKQREKEREIVQAQRASDMLQKKKEREQRREDQRVKREEDKRKREDARRKKREGKI